MSVRGCILLQAVLCIMQAYNKYKRLISRIICLCVGSAVLHEDFFFMYIRVLCVLNICKFILRFMSIRQVGQTVLCITQANSKYKHRVSRFICLCRFGSYACRRFYVHQDFMCIKYMQSHSEMYVNVTSRRIS